MALTQTVTNRTVIGNKRMVQGTFNAASVTGGDINTGLKRVESFIITPKGSAVLANQAVVNETLPLEGGDVTFVCNSNDTGTWLAVGD
jgi:hypothetical protein